MLYIIGLGLADEKDISAKGLEIVRKADRVYLEAYTAVLLVEQSVLVSRKPSEPIYRCRMPPTYNNRCSRKPTMAAQ